LQPPAVPGTDPALMKIKFGKMKKQSIMKRNTLMKAGLLACVMTGAITLSAYADKGDVKVKLSDCPAAVQKTLSAAVQAGGQITEIHIDKTKAGASVYEADVKTAQGKVEIQIAPDGKLIKTNAGGDDDKNGSDDDSK
jgi:hypothetical protein